ncbi:hypothetical protein ANN_18170 [Periplaneta americana]|uniref:DUF4817 domain-containing protein n=1 Tax=Periplaneta americana TaxID=6978 RepID=A0ABQ8SN01_PERAM|nr:hypothetical protein ANN_18170 [Periplaneta americana]
MPYSSRGENVTRERIVARNELLRNSRHHNIRSLLASALRGKNYQVEEEVHGLSTNGSTRRIDIIAIPTRSTIGFIIDPTVRMEMYENQPAESVIDVQRHYRTKFGADPPSGPKIRKWHTDLKARFFASGCDFIRTDYSCCKP